MGMGLREGHEGGVLSVSHGEGRVSPATPRNQNNNRPSRGQPQEAVQTLQNQTKLQRDTPLLNTQQSYTYLHPKPHQVSQRTHVARTHRDAPTRTRSTGGWPPSTCTHRAAQPADGVDTTGARMQGFQGGKGGGGCPILVVRVKLACAGKLPNESAAAPPPTPSWRFHHATLPWGAVSKSAQRLQYARTL